jgi:carbon monoxide dehydrogenase subunit G
MEMAGERLISASKQTVWAALNDPEILKASIPGCEKLEAAASGNEMTATVAIKLGPISAKFAGRVTLSDIDPPNGYTLSGEGKGGPAGFAKGAAKVKLTEQAGGTLLHYTVEAQVGGKLAQLGSRLIDTTAKSMADQFFTRFAEQVQPAAAEPMAAAPAPAAEPAKADAAKSNNAVWVLVATGLVLAVVSWFLAG